jgi:hypothetical protein
MKPMAKWSRSIWFGLSPLARIAWCPTESINWSWCEGRHRPRARDDTIETVARVGRLLAKWLTGPGPWTVHDEDGTGDVAPTSGRPGPPRCNRCTARRMHPYCFVPTVDSDHSARADSTRCKSAPMDGDGVGLWMSFFFGLTLHDGSVGFSTRRDDPSNREFSSIDSDL